MSFSIRREEFNSAFFQLESSIMYFSNIFELDGYRIFLTFCSRQLLNEVKKIRFLFSNIMKKGYQFWIRSAKMEAEKQLLINFFSCQIEK